MWAMEEGLGLLYGGWMGCTHTSKQTHTHTHTQTHTNADTYWGLCRSSYRAMVWIILRLFISAGRVSIMVDGVPVIVLHE